MPLRNTIPTLVAAAACLVFALGHAHAQERKQAEVIYEWNGVLDVALRELNRFQEEEALRHITGDNPPRSARAAAMVHAAIFEAVNGVTGKAKPFTPLRRESNDPIAVEAAVREAAMVTLQGLFGENGTEFGDTRKGEFADRDDIFRYDVVESEISSLWQSQQIHFFDNYTAEEIEAGEAWGRQVAEHILEQRREDGSHVKVSYEYTLDENGQGVEGQYITDKYTPDADNPPAEPGWGDVLPMAVSNIQSFTSQINGPTEIDWTPGSQWMQELHEVRLLGDRRRYDPDTWGGELPAEIEQQLKTAFFWSQKGLQADGGKSSSLSTTTPPGQWGDAANRLAAEHDLSLDDAARLFALLSVAGHDATVAAWEAKYDHNFWRPVHAIRWADDDTAAVDPYWLPLIPTSEHPEYVSGHSTASGSAAAILELFFGTDEMSITFRGDDALAGDEERTFNSFWAAAEEAGMSRIYGGIHYMPANEHGLLLGSLISEEVFANYFTLTAVPEPTSLGLLALGGALLLRRRRRGGDALQPARLA